MGKLLAITIGAAVAIIVLGGVLVPVIDDSTTLKEKELHQNVGTHYFKKVDSASISMVLGESFAVTVDGDAVDVGDYGIIVMSDTLAVSTGNQGELFAYDPVGNKFIAAGSEQGSATITIGSGAYTVSSGGNSITGTLSNVIVASDSTNGDYVYATAGTVNKDSPGLAYVGSILWGSKQGTVTITDLSSGSAAYKLASITDFVVSSTADATLTWEVTDNGDDSYDVASFADSTDSTLNVLTYIPVSYYTMEEIQAFTILNVIPALVIVAILVGVLAVVFRRSSE